MKNLFLGMLAAVFVVSCGTVALTNSSSAGKEMVSIENTKWTLADSVKGKTPTLTIESGKVNGNSGCNNFFGTLALDASTGAFRASQMGSTRMACENMAVENNFLSMMQKVNRYVTRGNTLELYQNDLLLLKFNKMQ